MRRKAFPIACAGAIAAAAALALVMTAPQTSELGTAAAAPDLALGSSEHLQLAALHAANTDAESQLLAGPLEREITVESGDTLMVLLTGAGIGVGEAHAAIEALRPVFRPADLRPGQQIILTVQPATDDPAALSLESLRLLASVREEVQVSRDAGIGFGARSIERPLESRLTRNDGIIDSSLFLAGERAGIPTAVLVELSRIFSFEVDFQRDIQPGDRFSVLYERLHDETGKPVATGAIAVAEMVVRDKPVRLYRFESEDGFVDYYDAQGKSVRKALMITPVDGARISSGFGQRRHPILGYTRMHRGIDFAAPTGTPVYAAGHGVVLQAATNGGYGKYIRIRHNETYDTAYAHLHNYARGITRGTRVRQGQIIGYVGSTGRSTGPHLHYEILKNGQQVNPRGLKLPSGRTLAGRELAEFLSQRKATDVRYARLAPSPQFAGRDGEDVACEVPAPATVTC